jgi:hypothetical protein
LSNLDTATNHHDVHIIAGATKVVVTYVTTYDISLYAKLADYIRDMAKDRE